MDPNLIDLSNYSPAINKKSSTQWSTMDSTYNSKAPFNPSRESLNQSFDSQQEWLFNRFMNPLNHPTINGRRSYTNAVDYNFNYGYNNYHQATGFQPPSSAGLSGWQNQRDYNGYDGLINGQSERSPGLESIWSQEDRWTSISSSSDLRSPPLSNFATAPMLTASHNISPGFNNNYEASQSSQDELISLLAKLYSSVKLNEQAAHSSSPPPSSSKQAIDPIGTPLKSQARRLVKARSEDTPIPSTTPILTPTRRRGKSSRQNNCMECVFCKNNGNPPSIYQNHVLKDPLGRVTCPILRAYDCPICHNGGGPSAHTIRYCPQNKPSNRIRHALLRSASGFNNTESIL